MKKNNIILLILSFWLAGCQHSLGNERTLITDVNTFYISEFDASALTKKRNSISFISGLSVDNCVQYLKEIRGSSVAEAVNDQIIHADYLACETYDLIKDTTIKKHQLKDNYGDLLSKKLDLTSFPSSLNRKARSLGPTLRDIGERFLKTNTSSVIYETDEWFYRLQVVAITDLNDDGVQDWIVWLEDKSKLGNYTAASTLAIANTKGDALLKAIPYFKLVR